MLRGAIDLNDGWRIGGWIHSPEVPVKDRLILAFVDGQCVGSGHVTIFRQDLADAGLGDGHCGFNFPITLARIDDRARVYVKLDWSDFALLQQTGRMVDGNAPTIAAHAYPAESIAWMRARGWIDNTQASALNDLTTTGLHAAAITDTPAATATRLFELYRQSPVRPQETLIRLSNLAAERDNLIRGAAIPLLAIHAPAGTITIGPVAHPCTDDRLLLIDARLPFAGTTDTNARVYRAV